MTETVVETNPVLSGCPDYRIVVPSSLPLRALIELIVWTVDLKVYVKISTFHNLNKCEFNSKWHTGMYKLIEIVKCVLIIHVFMHIHKQFGSPS